MFEGGTSGTFCCVVLAVPFGGWIFSFFTAQFLSSVFTSFHSADGDAVGLSDHHAAGKAGPRLLKKALNEGRAAKLTTHPGMQRQILLLVSA